MLSIIGAVSPRGPPGPQNYPVQGWHVLSAGQALNWQISSEVCSIRLSSGNRNSSGHKGGVNRPRQACIPLPRLTTRQECEQAPGTRSVTDKKLEEKPMEIRDCVVIITGASTGLAEAPAPIFARQGAKSAFTP